MKHFIETHFGIVLLLSCLVGLVLPGLPQLPNESAVLILALLMFTSCYRLREGGFSSIRWRDIGWFYIGRYVFLPLALWAVAHALVPDYALAIFLLSVLPAGVASPAFAHIYGGVAPPAFAVAIVSQLLAPFLIPLQFSLIGDVAVAPSPAHLFITMVWCIFVPMAIYAMVRKQPKLAGVMIENNKLFSILLVAFVIALAIAKQREVILAGGVALFASLVLTILCFAIYIIAGWFMVPGRPKPERITYATASSFNNAALGVSLALLHFSPAVILFVAVSEIAWSLLPMMFKWWLSCSVTK